MITSFSPKEAKKIRQHQTGGLCDWLQSVTGRFFSPMVSLPIHWPHLTDEKSTVLVAIYHCVRRKYFKNSHGWFTSLESLDRWCKRSTSRGSSYSTAKPHLGCWDNSAEKGSYEAITNIFQFQPWAQTPNNAILETTGSRLNLLSNNHLEKWSENAENVKTKDGLLKVKYADDASWRPNLLSSVELGIRSSVNKRKSSLFGVCCLRCSVSAVWF